ncbi:DeoR family transcriptional regulator [Ewingella americana]|uniref:DeoR family transcriptional regulator n=1 Tax=Ewingella americana TaxID=41202 RepID=UPI00163A9A97|nr:DeoR family transcriptional regulator [Ewingella americana]QMV52339.1 DeoR/GlpR transcriptional regulator [Ewingella americana]
MLKKNRHQAILRLVDEHEVVQVSELAEWLNVSLETIRRDLSEMQDQGLILRRHGRARRLIQQPTTGWVNSLQQAPQL